MAFVAKYDGTCAACSGPVVRGQLLTYRNKVVRHVDCRDTTARPREGAKATVTRVQRGVCAKCLKPVLSQQFAVVNSDGALVHLGLCLAVTPSPPRESATAKLARLTVPRLGHGE